MAGMKTRLSSIKYLGRSLDILSEARTFQSQGGIQTVKMVFSDPVDLAYDSDSLGR